ncbi:MAG TPA: helix-turn-helix transcriptional regulator [Terriglobia bacterium]|nr:helix-turn-helix transcriptional regulator [Terriglobia bacterium]
MLIGPRLRKLREGRKLSQGDITAVIGLPRSYVSRIENGHAVPSLETLKRLATALDVPLYRIFYAEEDIPKAGSSRQSWDELAEDRGPSGDEARFLIQMRALAKNLGRTERIFLLNLARRLVNPRSARQIADGPKEPEASSRKGRPRNREAEERNQR